MRLLEGPEQMTLSLERYLHTGVVFLLERSKEYKETAFNPLPVRRKKVTSKRRRNKCT